MSLVDTHCHLSHEQYAPDLEKVLARAEAAGVARVVSIASHLADAEDLVARVVRPGAPGVSPRVFGTAGIHPHEVGSLPGPASEGGREVLDRLRGLLAHPEVVAVGECGLDFHYDFAPAEAQFHWFQAQLQVAAEVGLPVVVHCREAEEEMIPRVREAGEAGVRGVLHCFPGDLALLETALEAGWSVSFTGNVTFRRFEGTAAVQAVPRGRYLLETDGPYLAPVPFRGKRNEPARVAQVRDRVAELRGELPEVVAADSTRAAEAFFGLGEPPGAPPSDAPGARPSDAPEF
jgi:TatD DNase family protein